LKEAPAELPDIHLSMKGGKLRVRILDGSKTIDELTVERSSESIASDDSEDEDE
jgi:hypothetical protein